MAIPTQTPLAINAELQALLTTISSAGQLIVRDATGVALAVLPLANPPAVIFNGQLVLLTMPQATAVSSLAPVGAIPVSADIVNGAGQPVITGLNVSVPQNTIILASSNVNPGSQLGVIGGCLAIP